jgi:2-keto-4-pentenoate hydratase
VDSIAALLTEARRHRKQVDAPGIESEHLAYAIQLKVCEAEGGFSAWKIGAVPPRNTIQSSPIIASSVRDSGATFTTGSFSMIGIEAEVAFILGREFRAVDGVPSDDEIKQGVSHARAALEIVDTRIAAWRQAPPLALLADNLCNGALVLGSDLPGWDQLNLRAPGFGIFVDGVVAAAPGVNAVEQPFGLLRVLLSHCAVRNINLPEGFVVTTGSSTGLHFVEPGSRVEVRLANRMMVSAQFE